MLPSERVAASVLLGIGDSVSKGDTSETSPRTLARGTRDTNGDDGSNSGSLEEDEIRKYIKEEVREPGEHDVLCGRGGGTNNHAGNVKFRTMVNGTNKLKYLAACKADKPKVAAAVVRMWRSLDPPGRFLTRKDTTRKGPGSVKAEGNIWYDVGDKKAREKASQCLRERTPDVIPFVREIQRQQDILIGQGLRDVENKIARSNPNASVQSASQSPPPLPPPGVPPGIRQQEAAAAVMPSFPLSASAPAMDRCLSTATVFLPPQPPNNPHASAIAAATLLRAQSAMNQLEAARLASLQPGPNPMAANVSANLLLYALAASAREQNAREALAASQLAAAAAAAANRDTLQASALSNNAGTPDDKGPVKKRRKKS